jgi:ATP-dependent Clp protease ATP-binding subunit ClpA
VFLPVNIRVQQAVEAAREHADALGWPCAGPLNLLWAVAAMDMGVAHSALLEVGVDPVRLRSEIAGRAKLLPSSEHPDPRSFTSAMVFSMLEAKGSGATHLDTEHILLGLLREPTGTLAEVCAQFNLTAEKARAAVEKLLRDDAGA